MAKTPVPVPNVVVVQGRSPFMPVVFVKPISLGTPKPAPPAPYIGTREDGCHAYLNYDAVSPIYYNGQNQTKTITQTGRP